MVKIGVSSTSQVINEFTCPLIYGTGEVAMFIGRDWVALSNSGPLLKDLVHKVPGSRGLLKNLDRLSVDDPGTGQGTLFFQPPRVAALLAKWEQYELAAASPDRAWVQQHHDEAAQAVMRATRTSVAEVEKMTAEQHAAFDRQVAEQSEKDWKQLVSLDSTLARLQGLSRLMQLFPGGQGQVHFDTASVPLILSRVVEVPIAGK
jgi:hypothetical protein